MTMFGFDAPRGRRGAATVGHTPMSCLMLALCIASAHCLRDDDPTQRVRARNGESQPRGLQEDTDWPTFSPTTAIPTLNPTAPSAFVPAPSDSTPPPSDPPIAIDPEPTTTIPPPEPAPSTAQASGGISEDDLNINNYCGQTWSEAYNTCALACPGGRDSECVALGENYACQSFTLCYERIQNGDVIPPPLPPAGTDEATDAPTPQPVADEATDAPTPQPVPTSPETASPIALRTYPDCPEEYSTETDYTTGALVSYFVPDSATTEVYGCQGVICNEGPSHAPGSENAHLAWTLVGYCDASTETQSTTGAVTTEGSGTTAAATTDTMKWWLKQPPGECAYGDDYPPEFMTNELLKERFIFESEAECCAKYPEFCNAATNATMAPTGSPAPSQFATKASVAPSAAATTVMPTMVPTYMPSNSAIVLQQRFWLGVAPVLVAVVF